MLEGLLVEHLELIDGLTSRHAHPGWRYTSHYDMVLRRGTLMRAIPRPKLIRKQRDRLCFENALRLTHKWPGLRYVEGYAMTDAVRMPLEHAWCLNPDGEVIDPTWRQPETSAYMGIAFPPAFIYEAALRTGYHGLIGNDWLNDFRLLKGEWEATT